MKQGKSSFRCILHGSFRKHLSVIEKVARLFTANDIEVIAPKLFSTSGEADGFVFFSGEEDKDPRLIELLYLQNLKRLGPEGFSYFVNPDGYIGKSAAYELGIAQATNTHCFFLKNLSDHPAYIHKNSIWRPEDLIEYVQKYQHLPEPKVRRNERVMHQLWEDLMVPGSVVATGGIIEYQSKKGRKEKEVLLVKTHKWGGRYSMVGGKVRRNERLSDALLREVKEETGLKGEVGAHICTFDQIKNSGYYQRGIQHIFVDNVVRVESRKVTLNEEAQDYLWVSVNEALTTLDIEPNARYTLELYRDSQVSC